MSFSLPYYCNIKSNTNFFGPIFQLWTGRNHATYPSHIFMFRFNATIKENSSKYKKLNVFLHLHNLEYLHIPLSTPDGSLMGCCQPAVHYHLSFHLHHTPHHRPPSHVHLPPHHLVLLITFTFLLPFSLLLIKVLLPLPPSSLPLLPSLSPWGPSYSLLAGKCTRE